MTNQDLLRKTEALPPDEEARWQKHWIVALWILVGAFVLISGILLWAEGHGGLQALRFHKIPTWGDPSWPDGS